MAFFRTNRQPPAQAARSSKTAEQAQAGCRAGLAGVVTPHCAPAPSRLREKTGRSSRYGQNSHELGYTGQNAAARSICRVRAASCGRLKWFASIMNCRQQSVRERARKGAPLGRWPAFFWLGRVDGHECGGRNEEPRRPPASVLGRQDILALAQRIAILSIAIPRVNRLIRLLIIRHRDPPRAVD